MGRYGQPNLTTTSSQRSVVVLGMHRSGTSAVTRVINLLGVPLAADDLFHLDENNPKGYWESSTLVAMNDRVLAQRGGSWSAPPPLPSDGSWAMTDDFVDLRAAAAATLAAVHRTQKWLWKDPRTCLTLPLWLAVSPAETTIVIVSRHPLEVALSLERREGFSTAYSLALWERYVRESLRSSTGLPTFVMRYERLLEAPAEATAELLAFLRGRGFDVHDPDLETLFDFLDPALRRARVEEAAVEVLSEQQAGLLLTLDALAGPHDALAVPPLDPEAPWVEALFAGRRAEEHARCRLEGWAREVADLDRRATELAQSLNAIEAELRVARDQLADETRRLQDAEAELHVARDQLADETRRRHEVEAELHLVKATWGWRLLEVLRRLRAVRLRHPPVA